MYVAPEEALPNQYIQDHIFEGDVLSAMHD